MSDPVAKVPSRRSTARRTRSTGPDGGPSLIVTADDVFHVTFADPAGNVGYYFEAGNSWEASLQPSVVTAHAPVLGANASVGASRPNSM